MRRFMLLCAVFLCAFTTKTDITTDPTDGKNFPDLLSSGPYSAAANHLVDSIYNVIHLSDAGLGKEAFFAAYQGYQYLLSEDKLAKKDLLSICDYSQSSDRKRLYVIDLASGTILFNTYVAHGRNSGNDMATTFSNLSSSNKSSQGFLVTAETYTGHNGYSLRFDGMERGINNNVRARDVVMHGSNYVCPERAANGTMMGRSFGCPAVSYTEHKQIIDKIKDGSCFFIYSNNALYAHTSPVLNAHFAWPALQPQIPLANTLQQMAVN